MLKFVQTAKELFWPSAKTESVVSPEATKSEENNEPKKYPDVFYHAHMTGLGMRKWDSSGKPQEKPADPEKDPRNYNQVGFANLMRELDLKARFERLAESSNNTIQPR